MEKGRRDRRDIFTKSPGFLCETKVSLLATPFFCTETRGRPFSLQQPVTGTAYTSRMLLWCPLFERTYACERGLFFSPENSHAGKKSSEVRDLSR
jgi:hypothetical protein